jgi:hypothetical protein
MKRQQLGRIDFSLQLGRSVFHLGELGREVDFYFSLKGVVKQRVRGFVYR